MSTNPRLDPVPKGSSLHPPSKLMSTYTPPFTRSVEHPRMPRPKHQEQHPRQRQHRQDVVGCTLRLIFWAATGIIWVAWLFSVRFSMVVRRACMCASWCAWVEWVSTSGDADSCVAEGGLRRRLYPRVSYSERREHETVG